MAPQIAPHHLRAAAAELAPAVISKVLMTRKVRTVPRIGGGISIVRDRMTDTTRKPTTDSHSEAGVSPDLCFLRGESRHFQNCSHDAFDIRKVTDEIGQILTANPHDATPVCIVRPRTKQHTK